MPEIEMDGLYMPSGNIVVRKIEGELIIVPLVSGIGDLDDELFSVNESGMVIWNKLDGKTSPRRIIEMLTTEYHGSPEEIEKDVRGFLGELISRKMITDARASGNSS